MMKTITEKWVFLSITINSQKNHFFVFRQISGFEEFGAGFKFHVLASEKGPDDKTRMQSFHPIDVGATEYALLLLYRKFKLYFC